MKTRNFNTTAFKEKLEASGQFPMLLFKFYRFQRHGKENCSAVPKNEMEA